MSTKVRYIPKETIEGGSYTRSYRNGQTNNIDYYESGTTAPWYNGYISEQIATGSSINSKVRPVVHERSEVTLFPNFLQNWTYSSQPYRVSTVGPDPMLQRLGSPNPLIAAGDLVITYPKTYDQLLSEAREAFFDVNETDNLLNVVEANQTLNSLVSIGKMLTRLKDDFRYLHSGARPNRPAHTWKTSDVSNLYLGWSFGFAPLISDLRKMARSLPKVRANLARIASRSALPHSVVRDCVGTITYTNPKTSAHDPDGTMLSTNYYAWWKPSLTQVRAPRRIAGIHGIRHQRFRNSTFQEIDYLLSRFVATGPASFAWERVKFSFVVDWFVNLSPVIEKLDNVLTGADKSVHYAWTSESYRVIAGVDIYTTPLYDFGRQGIRSSQNDILYYRRDPATVGSKVNWSGRFGKKQATLSVALLHQMMANLGRKSK